jgi:tRNA(Ile)-lysidine synthetase-like protein
LGHEDYNRHKLDAFVVRVHGYVSKQRLLPAGGLVVAAVSGGPDSMALLDGLLALGYRVVVAHLDHGIRPESWQEAEQVLRMAALRGVAAVAERGDVLARASDGENLEAAARRLRYAFLARVAVEAGACAVATGHTADDQVETFLMHLLRGSGTQGLRGMQASQPLSSLVPEAHAGRVQLVRPLLGVWRHETAEFCRRQGTPVIEDPSNQDQSLLRNRIRHELLPHLESYNPQARAAIHRAAETTAAVHAVLHAAAEKAWPDLAVPTEGAVLLCLEPLRKLPEVVQAQLLRRAMEACGSVNESADSLARALSLVQPGGPNHAQLGGGIEAWRAGQHLYLMHSGATGWKEFPQCRPGVTLALLARRRTRLEHGWSIICARVAGGGGLADQVRSERGASRAWVPVSSPSALSARAWTPGDRMRLFGSGGSVKVADLLSRCGVPLPARRGWPVVLLQDEVAWIPGVQRGELCRMTGREPEVMQLDLVAPRRVRNWLRPEPGTEADDD